MHFIISNNSNVPIYEQLVAIIKKAILENELCEGEALPSVRGLAKDLKISFLTVKKAYDELEKQGFITTVQGKGSFVLPKKGTLIREEQIKQLEKHIDEVIRISKLTKLSKAEVLSLFEAMYEED